MQGSFGFRTGIMNRATISVRNLILFVEIMVPVLCLSSAPVDSSVLKNGDAIYSFFWTRSATGTNNYGYYGLVNIISGQTKSATDESIGKFRLDRSSWWLKLVTNASSDITIVFQNEKPDSVSRCSGKFTSVPWFSTILGQTDTASYLMRFYFPILPQTQSYRQYDFFSIRINDSTDLQFHAVSDTSFTGSFISNGVGKATTIRAKNAFTILTTTRNALRIKKIEINGAHESYASSYLGFDLSSLKNNAAYYGLDIIDTTLVAQTEIQISNFKISGSPTLVADSTYRLSWIFDGSKAIDQSLLYVSVDSGVTWSTAGKVFGADTFSLWTAPRHESSHCFFKIVSIGTNGQSAIGLSTKFSIMVPGVIPDQLPPVNNYALSGSALDSTTVRLVWNLVGVQDSIADSIGIRFDTQHYPVSMDDVLSVRAGTFNLIDTCDTIFNLPKNQEYFFSLFVVNTHGVWSEATTNSRVRLRTGSISGQAVSIGIDTARATNDSLKIWSLTNFVQPYKDTLVEWIGPLIKPGFIQTSQGYSFIKGKLPANTSIKVKFFYRIAFAASGPEYQRMYLYNIYTGNWRISNYPVVVDTLTHTVTASMTDLSLPFVMMIDTLAPIVNNHVNNQAVFNVSQRIVDTFQIVDNIENPTIRLFAGPGNRESNDISLYLAAGQKSNEYISTIPPYVADRSFGLRASLDVDDGRNAQTVNLSRRIFRDGDNCDNVTAASMQWTPLATTAWPLDDSILNAISTTGNTGQYNYDKKNERVIQWLPQSENSAETNKWVEYEPAKDTLFKLAPGKLFWIRAKSDRPVNFSTSIVPSLKDTFTIALNGSGWTDFAAPFKFSVCVRDIVDATMGQLGLKPDSLLLYSWVNSGSNFRTEPIYLSGISDVGNPTDTIVGGSACAAYNSSSTPAMLLIPPICAEISRYRNQTYNKKIVDQTWSIRVDAIANNQEQLSPIYCASKTSADNTRWYPASPSFSTIKAGIWDQLQNRVYGHAAIGDLSQGGAMFDIIGENADTKQGQIIFSITKKNRLPSGINAGFLAIGLDGANGISDSLKVNLGPAQKATSYLIVGTNEYIKNIQSLLSTKLSFHVYPSRHGIRINYSIPFNTISLSARVFDLLGRSILARQISELNGRNSGVVILTDHIPQGMFIVELRADVKGSARLQVLRKKVAIVH